MKIRNKDFNFFVFPIVVVIVLALFKISGTSIGRYYDYFNGEVKDDKNLIYGQSRPIRSDEWLLSTPLVSGQSREGFPLVNSLIANGQNMVFSDSPILTWISFFKPQNFLYYILPFENAFALRWWVRSLFLLVGAFCLLLYLTKGDKKVSFLLSISFLYSPFFQWWYHTPVLEMTAWAFLILFFSLRLIDGDNKRWLIKSILLWYLCVSFVVVIYPPFQVPLCLFALFLFAGYLLNNKKYKSLFRQKLVWKIFVFLTVGVAVTLSVYFLFYKDAFVGVVSTVYPGKRISVGGDFAWLNLMGGFFDIGMLKGIPNDLFPFKLGNNQSEASSFFLFSFFLAPVFLYHLVTMVRHKKIDWVLTLVLLFQILFVVWMVYGLPSVLVKVFLLNYVPPVRAVLGLGVSNFFLIYYFLFKIKIQHSSVYKVFSLVYSLLLGIGFLYLAYLLRKEYPLFLFKYEVFLIGFFIWIITFLLLEQRKVLFSLFLLIFSLMSTITTNPLYVGLDPLLNTELSKVTREIVSDNKDSYWVVYDNLLLANYVMANGARVVNGTQYPPQLDYWRIFDVENKYESVYNRFAHVVFRLNDEGKEMFVLESNDVFSVRINPCDEIMKQVGVKYYLFTRETNFTCLSLKEKIAFPALSVLVYERIDY